MASATNIAAGIDGMSAMPRDYLQLLKPRVMSLVVFTAFVGMWVAPTGLPPALSVIALLAIAIGAGASGALNMWYDADIDAVMGRTASRPVPSGKISPSDALAFGLILSVLSVGTLGLMINWLAAGLLAFTIFFYAVIYTIGLKRSTPQNIVIGGAAGAFPPVIGWAAMTGSVGMEPWLLFLIIFLWTPPHFWALALFKADDYARAGVPMLPNVAGHTATRRQIFIYSILLAGAALLPWVAGHSGLLYAAVAFVLGAGFLRHAWKVYRMPETARGMEPAKRLFAYSIFYLFALFFALIADHALVAGG